MPSGGNSVRTVKMKHLWRSLTSVKSAAVGLLALSLSACQTTNTIVIDDCDIFAPISYSASQDTEKTVTQIRKHNARYLELCSII